MYKLTFAIEEDAGTIKVSTAPSFNLCDWEATLGEMEFASCIFEVVKASVRLYGQGVESVSLHSVEKQDE